MHVRRQTGRHTCTHTQTYTQTYTHTHIQQFFPHTNCHSDYQAFRLLNFEHSPKQLLCN